MQVCAALGVREGPDAQAVGRVELLHQELAAGFHHLGELQQARSGQQALDVCPPSVQVGLKERKVINRRFIHPVFKQ